MYYLRLSEALHRSPWLACLLVVVNTQSFDGVIRPTGDGRYEAYMVPPFKSNHASFLEVLPSGDLTLAWFSGSAEGQSGVAIVFTRLPLNATQWQNATVVSQREGYSNQNPVLFYDKVGKQLLLFHSQQKAGAGESDANVWELVSADGRGVNWTKPEAVFTKEGSFDRNRMVVSLQGNWMLPMYFAHGSGKEQHSALEVSSDHKKWSEMDFPGSDGLVQPSVVRVEQGKPNLVVFFRDRNAENIYWSHSMTDGKEWEKATKTTLPNNNSGIQANRLLSGNLVLVFNPTNKERNPLVIALSSDGGKTWPHIRALEDKKESVENSYEFSYPSVLQTLDGMIHVSYTYNRDTIKYVRLPEKWIMEKDEHVSY